MKVRLIAKPVFVAFPPELGMPKEDQLKGTDAEKIIEVAGRTCYDSFGKGRSSEEYHEHILDVGHGSVLEHPQFVFFITGVSRGLTHELVRHRIGVAISQRSTRYCDEADSPWIMHPLIRQYIDATDDKEAEYEWKQAVLKCQIVYRALVERLQGYLVNKGADKLSARKQARGAARGILGNSLETELVWSANVRALRHIISMRASDAADAEIRAMAMEVFKIIKEEVPGYFLDYIVNPASDGLGETVTTARPKV